MKKIFGLTLILIGIIVAISSLGGNIFTSKMAGGSTSVESIENLDIRKYNEIIVNTQASDLEVKLTEKPNMELLLRKGQKDFNISTYEKGKTLVIDLELKSKFNLFNFSSNQVTFFLPTEFKEKLSINQKAGNMRFHDPLLLRELHVDNKAGNIESIGGDFKRLTINSSAGNISGYNISAINTSIDAKAGNVKLNQFSGDLVGRSSAGNIDIHYQDKNGNVEWKASAGNVTFSIPEPDFKLEINSSFGNINVSGIPIDWISENSYGTVGSGSKEIKLRASAGNIEIRR